MLLLFQRLRRILASSSTAVVITTTAALDFGPSTLASSKLNRVHDARELPIITSALPAPVLAPALWDLKLTQPNPVPGTISNVSNPVPVAAITISTTIQAVLPTVDINVL
jgi:hypothetical protein